MIYGIVGAAISNYATKLKFVLGVDDALDIFAVHGVGGLVGNLLTAFFAADYIAHLDNVTSIPGGWVNNHFAQFGYQLADSAAGGLYSFFGTIVILFLINLIPGMHLRAPESAEILGIDDTEIGEFAYDYVELTRELLNDVEPCRVACDGGSSVVSHFDRVEKRSQTPGTQARAYPSMSGH